MNVKHQINCQGAILWMFHDKSMHISLTGKYAVLFMLFRPQFSFTSASEIHIFSSNFLFCNRNLSIFFV